MIATTTLLLPVLIAQALGIPILFMSHCALNFGSLGMIGVGAGAALWAVRNADCGVDRCCRARRPPQQAEPLCSAHPPLGWLRRVLEEETASQRNSVLPPIRPRGLDT